MAVALSWSAALAGLVPPFTRECGGGEEGEEEELGQFTVSPITTHTRLMVL